MKISAPSLRIRLLASTVLLVLIALALPLQSARADIGPKPTAKFTFVFPPGNDLTISRGTLYECSDAECSEPVALEELGPQGFECEPTSCSALAYGFSDFLLLEITFSDSTTRLSQVFTKRAFDAEYEVMVTETGLEVTETTGGLSLPNPITLLSSLIHGAALLGLCLLVGIPLLGAALLVWWAMRTRGQAQTGS